MANCTATNQDQCKSGAGIAAVKDGLLDFTEVSFTSSPIDGKTVGINVVGHTVIGQFDRGGSPQNWDYYTLRSDNLADTISPNGKEVTFNGEGKRVITVVYDNTYDHLEYPLHTEVLSKDAVPCLPGDKPCEQQPPLGGENPALTGIDTFGVEIILGVVVISAIIAKLFRRLIYESK